MEDRKKIVLVDDQITNLTLGRKTLSDLYEVFTVPSGEKLFLLLEKVMPDMILLDIEMPEMNGYQAIKKLKSNPETEHIPVIFLTAKSDTGSELEGLTLGAVDYISKPFSPALLSKHIEVHLLIVEQKKLVEKQKQKLKNYNNNLEDMVRQKTRTILELQNAILETVAELVESRDLTTGGHVHRTSEYLQILLEELIKDEKYSMVALAWDLELFLVSAQLHDVGKIAIRDDILLKPGKLTAEEFEAMKKHTTFGGEIIEKIQEKTSEQEFLNYAKIFALYHHEKWDGTGYPNGLKGEEIPLEGRLVAIVDTYDALVSERPYKKPFSREKAKDIIIEERGKQFDPILVDIFISVEDKFNEVRESTH